MKQKIDAQMEQNIRNYGDKIKTLESFVIAVRKRPGMYIGPIGNRGFINMIREIFQNSIDELQRNDSPCNHINILYDEGENEVIVEDNGRGLPFNDMIRICTSSHTSSNYEKEADDFTSGTNGVGIKVVNALSISFIVESYILGEARSLEFKDGIQETKEPVSFINKNYFQGTRIAFKPSYEVMGNITCTCQDVFNLIAMIFPLTKIGATLNFKGKDLAGNIIIDEKLINQDGIMTNLILKTSNPVIKPIYIYKTTGIMKAEIAFTYDSDSITTLESITSFSNFCPTVSGTHVDGFIDGLTRFFRDYMNKIYLNNNSKLVIISNDIKVGLKCIISAAHLEPLFTGQAKEILSNEDMFNFVRTLTISSLEQWSKENPNDLQKVCKYYKEIAEIRVKSDENKIKLSSNYKASSLSGGMPSKFVKPSGYKNLELVIVEGDSALGSARYSRCAQRQGLFPIRGKIPNAFNTTKASFLSNEEISSIITIIGGGYGKTFDISKVKWEKIIFMADADPDGSHINALLLKFFILYLPEMIIAGKVYRAVPPLFGVKEKKRNIFFTDTVEFTRYLYKLFSKDNIVTTITGDKLTNNEIIDIFVKNIDYTYELEIISNSYAINPYLLERVLGMYKISNLSNNNDFNLFKNTIKNQYRFLDVRKQNNIVIIEGLIDSIYQTIFLNDKLMGSCKNILTILDNTRLHMYKLNDNIISLYGLMKQFESTKPKEFTRYKGLGEQNSKQLGESTLHPDSDRCLIRYTIEDIKEEIEVIRFIESNKSELLKNINIKRQDIE